MTGLPAKSIVIYSDKKQSVIDEGRVTHFLQESQQIYNLSSVGQDRATVQIQSKAGRPALILLNVCGHYGDIGTDYDLLTRHLEIVHERPDTYLIGAGDPTDNVNPSLGRVSAAMLTQAINPGLQNRTFVGTKLKEMDEAAKTLCIALGNHEDFLGSAGISFEETYFADFKCPIFPTGGLLRIKFGMQEYLIAVSHKYRGGGFRNPTGAAKTYMEFEYPEADVSFLGHTHVKSIEIFTKGGKQRVAVIGGTYKTHDAYSSKNYGTPQIGGACIAIWPDTKRIIPFYNIEEAVAILG